MGNWTHHDRREACANANTKPRRPLPSEQHPELDQWASSEETTLLNPRQTALHSASAATGKKNKIYFVQSCACLLSPAGAPDPSIANSQRPWPRRQMPSSGHCRRSNCCHRRTRLCSTRRLGWRYTSQCTLRLHLRHNRNPASRRSRAQSRQPTKRSGCSCSCRAQLNSAPETIGTGVETAT